MSVHSSIEVALEEAKVSVDEIRHLLKQHNIISDPFSPTAPVSSLDALNEPRKRLANAAARLLQLATDPKEYLDNVAMSYQNLACLRWLVNLDVITQIPGSGAISYVDLATKAGVPQNQLRAVCRMAQAHGFLHEPDTDQVAHSRHSALMVKDRSFLEWAKWMTNYSVPSALAIADATQKWGATEKKDETAFNLGMDVKGPFFDHLRSNQEMNSLFSSYMRNVAATEGISFKHLVRGFDWGSLPNGAIVVDVGGSTGHASIALAQEFPHLNFVVEDLPETIASSRKAFATNPIAADRGVSSRIAFREHDFFTPQPIADADVYLLRMILHDWPDSEATKILSHLTAALQKTGARVIIMDTVLPEPGTIPILHERQLRVRDLTMIEVFNAKERELGDWKVLTSTAGLEIHNYVQPSGSVMGVLEVVRKTSTSQSTKANGSTVQAAAVGAAAVGATAVGIPRPSTSINGTNGTHASSAEAARTLGETYPSSMYKKLPVLIIGGGIGGLCLAQGLKKGGIDAILFERDLSENYRPQGYRLKLEDDAAAALKETLASDVYEQFLTSCAISTVGETDFDPISGRITKSRKGGGLQGGGLRATFTVDRGVFRNQLMRGLDHQILFGKELDHYQANEDTGVVTAVFKDGSSYQGRFLVGADGTRSVVRKQHLPDHRFVDTGARCIYGKTVMTPDLLKRFPARGLRWMTAASDCAPLIQSILIDDSPLTLLSEPITFEAKSRSLVPDLPEDYVYWVLIGRKELFTIPGNDLDLRGTAAAKLSLALTDEWDPSLRSLFELQDETQASTFRVASATPEAAAWKPSRLVTVIGDAVHAMSPCGGVGANTALRDAADLARAITDAGNAGITADDVGVFEGNMRARTVRSLMRSFAGSKKMFDQRPYKQCEVLEEW